MRVKSNMFFMGITTYATNPEQGQNDDEIILEYNQVQLNFFLKLQFHPSLGNA